MTPLLLLSLTIPILHAAPNEISGFRFQTCFANRKCVEVTAKKGWLSQLNPGFTTSPDARVIIRKATGEVETQWKSVVATYHPSIKLIDVDTNDQTAVFVSTINGEVDTQTRELFPPRKP